jgi:hypothetical protein
MKRLFLLLGPAVLFLACGPGHGGPVKTFEPEEAELAPMASRNYTLEFRGGKRATVLALGNGATYLGLYVNDAQGNCIAWDDEGNLLTSDDLAVGWTPQENAFYSIEVINAGLVRNKCRLYMR